MEVGRAGGGERRSEEEETEEKEKRIRRKRGDSEERDLLEREPEWRRSSAGSGCWLDSRSGEV